MTDTFPKKLQLWNIFFDASVIEDSKMPKVGKKLQTYFRHFKFLITLSTKLLLFFLSSMYQ